MRHVDATGELVLGEAQALAGAADELCHVPHRFGIVLALLCGDVLFGHGLEVKFGGLEAKFDGLRFTLNIVLVLVGLLVALGLLEPVSKLLSS